MYPHAGSTVACVRQALPALTESLSKNTACRFRLARVGRAKIVRIIRFIIETHTNASAWTRAPQQQTEGKAGFSFRSSETNFNSLISRINSYVAARQILLSDPIKFANVPPDTHGCSQRVAVQGLARNIYPHPRPPDRLNDLHRSVQRNARANVRECFANRVAVRAIFFGRGAPDQVPVRVENASSVWPR
jgi:hypothetical protein